MFRLDKETLSYFVFFVLVLETVFLLACTFVLDGAYDLYPTGVKFPRPGKMSVEFLDKIKVENLSYDEIVDKSFEAVQNKLNEYKK